MRLLSWGKSLLRRGRLDKPHPVEHRLGAADRGRGPGPLVQLCFFGAAIKTYELCHCGRSCVARGK